MSEVEIPQALVENPKAGLKTRVSGEGWSRFKREAKKRGRRPKVYQNAYRGTARMYQYTRNRMLGMNRRDAALSAGYGIKHVDARARKLDKLFLPDIVSELNQAGATDRAIAVRITSKFDAKRPVNASILVKGDGGEIEKAEDVGMIEVDDHSTQLEALKLACKLKGHLKPDTHIEVNKQTNFMVVLDDGKPERDSQAHVETNGSVPAPDKS